MISAEGLSVWKLQGLGDGPRRTQDPAAIRALRQANTERLGIADLRADLRPFEMRRCSMSFSKKPAEPPLLAEGGVHRAARSPDDPFSCPR